MNLWLRGVGEAVVKSIASSTTGVLYSKIKSLFVDHGGNESDLYEETQSSKGTPSSGRWKYTRTPDLPDDKWGLVRDYKFLSALTIGDVIWLTIILGLAIIFYIWLKSRDKVNQLPKPKKTFEEKVKPYMELKEEVVVTGHYEEPPEYESLMPPIRPYREERVEPPYHRRDPTNGQRYVSATQSHPSTAVWENTSNTNRNFFPNATQSQGHSSVTATAPPAYVDLEATLSEEERLRHEYEETRRRLAQNRSATRVQQMRAELQRAQQMVEQGLDPGPLRDLSHHQSMNRTEEQSARPLPHVYESHPSTSSQRSENIVRSDDGGVATSTSRLSYEDGLLAAMRVALQEGTGVQTVRPNADKQKPPKFNGDRTQAYEWLKDVNRISASNGWSDAIKAQAIGTYLIGPAKLWYNSIERSDMTWSEFEVKFRTRYLPTASQFDVVREFHASTQQANETATVFVDRVLNLRAKTGSVGIDDRMVAQVIRMGLRSSMYKTQVASNHLTLDDVVSKILDLESCNVKEGHLNQYNRSSYDNRNQNKTNETQETTAVQPIIQAPQEDPPEEPNNPLNQPIGNGGARRGGRFQYMCANCGRTGHSYRNCRQPMDEQRVNDFLENLRALRGRPAPRGPNNAPNTNANRVDGLNYNWDVPPLPRKHHFGRDSMTNVVSTDEENTPEGDNYCEVLKPESEGSKQINGWTYGYYPKETEDVPPVKPITELMSIPTLRVRMHNIEIEAIIDTGSNITAIDQYLAKKLKTSTYFPWKYDVCRNFDGSTHRPLYVMRQVKIEFNNQVVFMDVVVVPKLGTRVVLGIDYKTLANIAIYEPLMHITTRDDPNTNLLIEKCNQIHQKMEGKKVDLRKRSHYETAIRRINVFPSGGETTEAVESSDGLTTEADESMYDEDSDDNPTPKARVVEDTLLLPNKPELVLMRIRDERTLEEEYWYKVRPNPKNENLEVIETDVHSISQEFYAIINNVSEKPIILAKDSKPVRLYRSNKHCIEPDCREISPNAWLRALPMSCTSEEEDSNDTIMYETSDIETMMNYTEFYPQSGKKVIEVNSNVFSTREDYLKNFAIGPQLTTAERREVEDFVLEYRDRFYFVGDQIGTIDIWEHTIDTGDALPIHVPPYKTSPKDRQQIDEIINQLLQDGVIVPSCSPWSFGIVLVPKRDGGVRMCIDYKPLNSVTRPDSHPMPLIQDGLDFIGGHDLFTTLDANQMFYHLRVAKDSQEKTAFSSYNGHYHFLRMPFGLINSPSSCVRAMNMIFAQENRNICYIYIDDIIIPSKGFRQHMDRMRAVFEKLREFGVKLKASKCKLLFESVSFLGHKITYEGVSPDPERIKAIENFKAPTNVKEVQMILGFCGFFRRFYPKFSMKAEPLTRLLRTDAKWEWGEEQQQAWEWMKARLLGEPILVHYDQTAEHELHTDACDYGIAGILAQYKDKKLQGYVVAVSKTLTSAERNYCTTEKEAYAVVWSILKLRPYLHGIHFKVVTDHHSLCSLMKGKSPNSRLVRWSLSLQPYEFDVVYKEGRLHRDADMLSRCPLAAGSEADSSDDIPEVFATKQNEVIPDLTLELMEELTKFDINKEQREDTYCRKFIEILEHDLHSDRYKEKHAKRFVLFDGKLFHSHEVDDHLVYRLCVPRNMVQTVLKAAHDIELSGHLGRDKTYARVRDKYFWPNQYEDVRKYVKTCDSCQRRKADNQNREGVPRPMPVGQMPFEIVSMDITGPLPVSNNGNEYIVAINDTLTKFAIAEPIPHTQDVVIMDVLLRRVILIFGPPKVVITDQGTNLCSGAAKKFYTKFGIRHNTTTAYRPQSNGQTENFNKFIGQYLTILSGQSRDWDQYVPYLCYAYNSSRHDSTGVTPYYLLIGAEPRMPYDEMIGYQELRDTENARDDQLDRLAEIRQIALQRNLESKQKYQKRNLRAKVPVFRIGQKVMRLRKAVKKSKFGKLKNRYDGPYVVLEMVAENVYKIGTLKGAVRALNINVAQLKPYHLRGAVSTDSDDPPMPVLEIAEYEADTEETEVDETYNVEQIDESMPILEPMVENNYVFVNSTLEESVRAQDGDSMRNESLEDIVEDVNEWELIGQQ